MFEELELACVEDFLAKETIIYEDMEKQINFSLCLLVHKILIWLLSFLN